MRLIIPVLLQRPLQLALNFALLAALCALAAHWTWDAFSPDQVALLPKQEMVQQKVFATIVQAHLFGGETTESAQLPPGLVLNGTFAPKNGSPGAAIFSELGKGSRVVLVGSQVAPGFFLEGIAADHVVLTHNGARTELKLQLIAPILNLTGK